MRYVATSETSFKGAVDNLPRAGTQRRQILDTLTEVREGLTRDELEVVLQLSGNAIRPRVRELQEEGHVEETTRTRRTRSGSQAAVLVARNSGVESGSTGRATLDSGVADEASSVPPRPTEGVSSPPGSSESLFSVPSAYDVWVDEA